LLRTGDPAFRRAYLQLFIDDIQAKDGELTLTGSEDALAAAVAYGPKLAEGGVHAFVHVWRPHRDSNPGYRRERGITASRSVRKCPKKPNKTNKTAISDQWLSGRVRHRILDTYWTQIRHLVTAVS
jgi:hypothetical protein